MYGHDDPDRRPGAGSLAAPTGAAVDSLDLKGQYKGTPVDVETDPELYRMVIEAFPDAWLEDPDVGRQPALGQVEAVRVAEDHGPVRVATRAGRVEPPQVHI
jgi:hypothetical protein